MIQMIFLTNHDLANLHENKKGKQSKEI